MIRKKRDWARSDYSGSIRIAVIAMAIIACAKLLGRPAPSSPFLQATSRRSGPLDQATQLVFVTTADWNAVNGMLRLYERATPNAPWHAAGGMFPVVVGRNGLAWGAGLEGQPSAFADKSEPVKKEGDGKAPSGVFQFGAVFADASHFPIRTSLPSIQITPTLECVDDPHSDYYNRIVDRAATSGKWKSSEHMQRSDGLYRLGIVVDYNTNPTLPGRGSCIFLHVWSGPGNGTAGCTAMPEAEISKIAAWLDPKKYPVLVQLPRPDVPRYIAKWALPDQ